MDSTTTLFSFKLNNLDKQKSAASSNAFGVAGGLGFEPRDRSRGHGLANRSINHSRIPPERIGFLGNVASLVEEAVGFEPTKLALGCFQDSCLQPLGHTSV